MDDALPTVIVRAIVSLVVLFVLATSFLGLRIWARSTLLRTWRLAVDDSCLIVAWVIVAVTFSARQFKLIQDADIIHGPIVPPHRDPQCLYFR